jgi:biopolymer transport protein ExbB
MKAQIEYTINYWSAGGYLLLPLAVICFCIWLWFFRTRRLLKREMRSASLVAGALKDSNRSSLCKLSGGLAYMVQSLLVQSDDGSAFMRRFDDEGERYVDMLKRDILVLAAFTTAAPLLGLLGTVVGMMQTFSAVGGGTAEITTRVSDGVSRALITTQVGLVIAIPGVFALAHLRRLVKYLLVELGEVKLNAVFLKDGYEAHNI